MAEPFDPETVRAALANRDRWDAWVQQKSPWDPSYVGWDGQTPQNCPFPYDNIAWNWLRSLLASHDAHAGEVEALREIVATLEQHVGERDARLHEVRDFLEDQFDVEDGDEGDVLPNWAMRAVNIIDQPWAERRKS